MMMIRSQDREILVPLNRPIYVSGRQVIYCEEIESSNGSLIGNYASESRCLEILDEIQKMYSGYLSVNGGQSVLQGGGMVQPFAFIPPKVYQMPEK